MAGGVVVAGLVAERSRRCKKGRDTNTIRWISQGQ